MISLFVFVFVCRVKCSNIPNRSTFVCPFCGARNLDQQELVKHCMENHRNDPNKVVRDFSLLLSGNTGDAKCCQSVFFTAWTTFKIIRNLIPVLLLFCHPKKIVVPQVSGFSKRLTCFLFFS